MPPHQQSSLFRPVNLLCPWIALVSLAAFRMSAADVGLRNHADLVVVPVTIINHKGEAVSGLRGSQFHVLDNGERVPRFPSNGINALCPSWWLSIQAPACITKRRRGDRLWCWLRQRLRGKDLGKFGCEEDSLKGSGSLGQRDSERCPHSVKALFLTRRP